MINELNLLILAVGHVTDDLNLSILTVGHVVDNLNLLRKILLVFSCPGGRKT